VFNVSVNMTITAISCLAVECSSVSASEYLCSACYEYYKVGLIIPTVLIVNWEF
jgi:hypothetical protein